LNTPESQLSEFSSVIKALAATTEESSERLLALWRYIQRYYPESAYREMDEAEIARADRLLDSVNADKIHRKTVLWKRVNNCLIVISIAYCALRWFHFL
jgi:hypothetical protein